MLIKRKSTREIKIAHRIRNRLKLFDVISQQAALTGHFSYVVGGIRAELVLDYVIVVRSGKRHSQSMKYPKKTTFWQRAKKGRRICYLVSLINVGSGHFSAGTVQGAAVPSASSTPPPLTPFRQWTGRQVITP